MITVVPTPLDGVVVIEPRVFEDDRGFFMEIFNAADFAAAGLPSEFVQDNHSRSTRGVLRGLHYQYPQWQGKLVRAIQGEIFDVAVDIRRTSPGFGRWYGIRLSASNRRQLYIPAGFAHGFCVLSDTADVIYKCTTAYKPADDAAIRWDDPDIGIEWPVSAPAVSDKDARGKSLRSLPRQ
jgi:dTDP-4-dehydrorhamnose 3,5-epimerase